MSELRTESYLAQLRRWPASGRHLLAQFDDESVVVYQAYRPEIGRFAASNGYFGAGFSLARMSWIKPGFLWTMYRSGWGEKPDQETVLAVRLKRSAFDEILRNAVPSSWDRKGTRKDWQAAVGASSVRLQWDPDHHPTGAPEARRAIQLGLRGATLARYAREWIRSIEDISGLVALQRALVREGRIGELVTPAEAPYPVSSEVASQICLAEGEQA